MGLSLSTPVEVRWRWESVFRILHWPYQ